MIKHLSQNVHIIGTSILVSLLATAPALSQEEIKSGNPSFFFTIDITDEETLEFQDTIVPNIPDNVCYGWRLKLNDDRSLVQYTEEFILPSKPATWEAESNPYSTSTISKDRTTSITKEFAAPKDGWISNHWCIAEGDPNGPHKMKISVADKPMGEVNFEVVPMDEFRKHSNLK